MSRTELARILAFCCSVLSVYVVAGLMALRYARFRFLRKGPQPSRRWMWTFRAFLALAAAGLACTAYARFVEPYWLQVTRVSLESPKLPKGCRPIRIVHLSDLHSDPTPRLEERLPEVVAAEKPDLIVFTGDAVNSADGLPVARKCLGRLAAIAPTFAVRGNWEWLVAADACEGLPIRQLNGEAVKVTVGSAEVWVAGVAVGNENRAAQALRAVPEGAFVLFLYHAPDMIYELAERGVDLFCCGHTHGGQVALPFYGAMVTLSGTGKRFEAGLHRVKDTWLYTSRGIGMEGGPVPRVRFCSRPEVAVIEISPTP